MFILSLLCFAYCVNARHSDSIKCCYYHVVNGEMRSDMLQRKRLLMHAIIVPAEPRNQIVSSDTDANGNDYNANDKYDNADPSEAGGWGASAPPR